MTPPESKRKSQDDGRAAASQSSPDGPARPSRRESEFDGSVAGPAQPGRGGLRLVQGAAPAQHHAPSQSDRGSLAAVAGTAGEVPVREQPSTGWAPRSVAALTGAQLAALHVYLQRRRERPTVAHPAGQGPEQRMDTDRLAATRQREHEAVLRFAAEQLLLSGQEPMPDCPGPRIVLAHRSPWFRLQVATGLAECGVQVLAQLEDGAETCAAVLIEQPDLLLVEDRLPSMTGLEVIQRTHELSPSTLAAVQLQDASPVKAFLAAGARVLFTRRLGAPDVVDQVLRLLEPSEFDPAIA